MRKIEHECRRCRDSTSAGEFSAARNRLRNDPTPIAFVQQFTRSVAFRLTPPSENSNVCRIHIPMDNAAGAQRTIPPFVK